MRSMTGFGRGEHADHSMSYGVELSSVNRKQADIPISLPRNFTSLESRIRKSVLARVSRGRVGTSVQAKPLATGKKLSGLRVDHDLAGQYLEELRQLASAGNIDLEISAGDLLQAPGVFEVQHKIEAESAWEGISVALEKALEQLIAMREFEGQHLLEDLEKRIALVEAEKACIHELAPMVVEHHRKNLTSRLAKSGLPLPLEDERLVREISLFAERIDITEELTRLDSHISKFRELIHATEPTGRALDFLTQELFREFNTIGSKANNATIAQHVVTAKTELEKIREQIQNVE